MNRFRLPEHLKVEAGIFNDIPDAMEDVFPGLHRKKAILVTEENLKNIFEKIIAEIRRDFESCELYLISSADYDSSTALAKYITMQDIAVVIGFGGGTVLDLAKFAAFVSKAKYISLPTTLSNDSLASPVAVLGTTGKARKSFKCTIPDAILVDTDVIKSAPVRQLLSGIGDTISKDTALYDWKLAGEKAGDKVDDFAYMMSRMAYDSLRHSTDAELKSDDFLTRLTRALVMGGLAMEIAGSSRPSSGSEHLFCHALEEYFYEEVNVPHGIAVAMGSVGAAVFQGRKPDEILELIRAYGIPAKPSENKVTKDIFIGAWQRAASTRADRYTVLNEADLGNEALEKIYELMEERL